MIASCGFLENELSQFSKKESVTLAGSVETLGVDLRTRVRRLGTEEKVVRKKCKVRFSLIKKNKVFQTRYMKVGVKKLLREGVVPARTWGVHAVRFGPCGEIKQLRRHTAAAAGEKSTTLLSLFMKACGFEVEEELSTLATQHWAEEFWIGKWRHEQKRSSDGNRFEKCRCGDR